MSRKFPSIESVRHIHIVGVCGTLMGAFASFMKKKGLRVTGSDQNVYPPMSDVLRDAGVELFEGYRAENLTASGSKPDLVIIGNVVRRDNPEAVEAMEKGYVYSSLPEVMENLLLKDTRNILASGTHGKTTTSSLMTHVLRTAGEDPSYFIGGVSLDLPVSFYLGEKGRYFVLEGDEYDTAFWDKVPKFNHYLPNDVILTSVEYDHADIYPNLEVLLAAFEGLVDRIRPGGRLIACVDYPEMRRIIERARARSGIEIVTYGSGVETGARFAPAEIRFEPTRTVFKVMENGREVDEVEIPLSGIYNVLNALGVWTEARSLGLDAERVRRGLRSFRGVKRRMEVRGEERGVTVIDDFAHHPTAVRETLKAIRHRYPGRRVIAVFEPRSATSRRKVFQKDFTQSFREADLLAIARPFDQSRIDEGDRFSSEEVVADLLGGGMKEAFSFGEAEEGVERVASVARAGDVVAVLSNGGFGGFIPKLLERLKY